MMRSVLPRLLAVAVLNSGAVSAWSMSSGTPITIENGYPVVEVFINSRGPLRMVLDTGANACSLSPKAALSANVSPEHQKLVATVAGEKMVEAAFVPLQLGSFEALRSEVLIYDIPAVSRLNRHLDGLLGQSFLSQRPYLLDYRARRLWFGAEATAKAQRLSQPLNVRKNYNRVLLPVEIGTAKKFFHLVLDSGTSNMLLECNTDCPALIGSRAANLTTNTAQTTVLQGQVRDVRIQDVKLSSLPTVLMETSNCHDESDGLFPARAFSTIYVDVAHGVVRIAH